MPQKNTNSGQYNREIIGGNRGAHVAISVLNLNDTINNEIAKILGNMSFSVVENLYEKGGKIASIVSNFFGKKSTENPEETQKILELLKDHHGTFSIFEQGIMEAYKMKGENTSISIGLYKRDVNHPNFIATLKAAIQSGIDPNFIILEIHADDYGLVDSIFIKNLKEAKKLGFPFSFHSFILVGKKIKISNLTKLIAENIYPKFIKISKEVYDTLQHSLIEISNDVKKCYDMLKEKGIHFIESHSVKERYFYTNSSQKKPSFFENSTIKKEGIFGIDGREYGKELLIRFGDGVSVLQGLEDLKKRGMTMLTVEKMLKEATTDIVTTDILLGKMRFINTYVKNLGDKNFRAEVLFNTSGIPIDYRKFLIFEILEDGYGALSDRAIENIIFLQKSGFSIAIDDLYLDDIQEGMSKEILEIFIEKEICPNFIKIDGRHIQKICSINTNSDIKTNEETKILIHHLREVIGQFSLFNEPPIFIAKWIQNTDEAKKIQELLATKKIEFFFQGRNIQS